MLMTSPELCDVVFLVGDEREPVHGVKAILCARSKAFQKLLQAQTNVSRKSHRKLSDVKPTNIKSGLGNLRLFNRRASDTTHLSAGGELALSAPSLNSTPINPSLQIVVEEYDAHVYRKLMEYLHTGTIVFQPKSIVGLMIAAEQYGLEDLTQGCASFMRHCVNINTVCDLLISAEKYIQFKTTKVYIQKVMDFIDKNAESVLIQQQLTELPRHVLSLVLTRDDVHASALTKFNAALAWSRAQLRKDPNQDLAEIFSPFVDVIQFDAIPASVLMREVKPMSLVPDNIIMGALAYQADPESIPPPNPGSRRPSGRNLCTTDEESIGSTTDLQEEMNKLSVKIDSDN